MKSVVAFVHDGELFRIEGKNVREVLSLLQAADKNDHLWMAYKNTGAPTQARDLLFFQSRADATEFALNQKMIGEIYTALPIEATQRLLTNSGEIEQLIIRDTKEIINLQDEINFNLSAAMMEHTMRGHNWKDMDTETLHDFITDLKGMHDESLKGKQLVEQLVRTHWPDMLIEPKLLLNNSNTITMNEKNLDFLAKQLKYTGFGEELLDKLKESLKSGQPNFTLGYQKDFGNDQTASTLHFRKSDESDMYFFNRYTLILKNNQHPDAVQQTFHVNQKADNITLKEAYNLMAGRSIHKDLTDKNNVEYKAWLQIDFKNTDENGNYKMKQYHQNYGYDLTAALAKHPIKELQTSEHKDRLIESLERGNRQSVTLVVSGREQKVSIEAVPQFKSLNFYDASGQRLRSDKLYENNSQEQSVKKEVKQNAKVSGDEEEGPGEGQKKSRKRAQRIS